MNKTYLFCTLAYILISTFSYSQYTKLLNFEGATNGRYPTGSLITDGTFLYGTTTNGGTSDFGTLFKIMTDGTGYVKLLNFEGATNGKRPCGSLMSDGTFLYGMTSNGGINDFGTIFKIMPDGTGYEKLLDFAGATNGSYPFGSLMSDGTFLYGMANQGGTNSKGTIFKIMPDGSGYVKLLDFADITNGRRPSGSLISDVTFLYGMTEMGGTNDFGTLFKIMPNGTGYVKLLDFAGATNGSYPFFGSLISDGTFLFGMTSQGGINGIGTIFKIISDGSGYVKLLDFAGATNGGSPYGSIISDGSFLYGMTEQGGTSGYGVVFKIGMTTGIDETNTESLFTIYPNPSSGIINISTSVNDLEFISITNILGEAVLSKEVNVAADSPFTIDMSDHLAGIYFLRVGNCTKRIIRE